MKSFSILGKTLFVATSVLVGLFYLGVGSANAVAPDVTVNDSSYSAKFVSQSIPDPIEIKTGESKTITFKFKNIGTATWSSSGGRHISAYTMEPRYRVSGFMGDGWVSSKQTALIKGTVKPGEIGELVLNIKAPNQVGEYTEKFYLAAENHTWLKGGYFYIKIKVLANGSGSIEATVDVADEISSATDGEDESVSTYVGKRLFLTNNKIENKGGEQIKMLFAYQNLGGSTWNNVIIKSGGISRVASTGGSVSFADDSWLGQNLIKEKTIEVSPYEFLRDELYIRTPTSAGSYTASIIVEVDGHIIEKILIPVTVTEDAPLHYSPPVFSDNSIETEVTVAPWLDYEPRIRVGLWKPESAVQFVSYEDNYYVLDGTTRRGTLPARKIGILKYAGGVYSFEGGDLSFRTNNFIRLEPVSNPHAVFTLYNWQRNVSWKGSANFNKYRGAMEYRLTQDGTQLYVINDILMEDYVKGIAETSNSAPIEMQKAQAVVARTYAYYIKENSSKHDKRYFDVVATTGDQLYLGANCEEVSPNYVSATNATRGYMVTYDNKIVITPYFGNTDGRTRSWQQVWGGSTHPWLVSVSAQYDAGRSLYGHGVGMSQRDATIRADKEGSSWQELIHHYYTGVEIEQIY